jgi:hypothetical protein
MVTMLGDASLPHLGFVRKVHGGKREAERVAIFGIAPLRLDSGINYKRFSRSRAPWTMRRTNTSSPPKR